MLSLHPRTAIATPLRPCLRVLVSACQRRRVHDIMISRTGKPIIRKGPGGRSSSSGHIATVFGATGLLGKYLVSKLAKQGSQVVIPYRDLTWALPLKVSGDLGMVMLHEFDVRNQDDIEAMVRHSDTVYNLIGREWETKNFKFPEVHIRVAQRIAEACAKYNVSRLVHVSSYNADPKSESQFYSTKGLGEIAVREAFPTATIVRPPPMFGGADRLLNPMAAARFYFTSASLRANTVRPAYVNDVALALELMMHDPATVGQTFDLAGPEAHTRAELLSIVLKYVFRQPRVVLIPRQLKQLIAYARDYFIYWHTPGWTPDEVTREHIDHVRSTHGPNGEPVLGWKDLVGMTQLEPVDGLVTKTQLRVFQRGMKSTPVPKRKSAIERAREAEMNSIL